MNTLQFTEAIPLSLYIHIPWCVRKCPYCDFNSHAVRDELPEAKYVAALLEDLEQELPLVWGRRVSSIFIGGGTPSLFSAESLANLLQGIRARIPLLPEAEVTLEANPGTAEAERFAGYREAGVNRLSLGVQSFNSSRLKQIGRIHDGDEAHQAIEYTRAAGFDNFNLDLMFALPGQDIAGIEEDLRQAVAHAPTHISFYQLTLEPNTAFYQSPPKLPESDCMADMEQAGHALLSEQGYQRYEVSAFSRPGKQARHNLNYWEFGDYLGIGAGAHGKLTDMASGRVIRRRKQRQPSRYLDPAGEFLSAEEEVTPRELPFEFMLNASRLIHGYEQSLFSERTGLPWKAVAGEIASLVEENLLTVTEGRVRPTERGMLFLNDVMARFLLEKGK